MKALHFLLGILSAVFFFVFGLFFQASFSRDPGETSREPSSLSNAAKNISAKFDSKATEAFRGCIDSRIKNGSVNIGKVEVEGRRWSIISIPCQGDAARGLYNAIQPYSSEEFVRYRDQRRGVVRFFGRLYPPSQCVQLISSGKGKEVNEYSCSIRIDVDTEITEQLKL